MPIKYYPEDDARGYGTIGFKLPINGRGLSNSGFFNVSYTTEEQAISNYINLLLTRKGERYMHPRYGIGIQLFLFEQNTELLRTKIEQEIRQQCGFWLPYIFNHEVNVRDRADIPGLNSDPESAVHITITFSVTEQGANKSIELFQRGGITTAQILN